MLNICCSACDHKHNIALWTPPASSVDVCQKSGQFEQAVIWAASLTFVAALVATSLPLGNNLWSGADVC